MDVGNVAPEWRAKYAVPDETLVQKLCKTLDNILGDTVLPEVWTSSGIPYYWREREEHAERGLSKVDHLGMADDKRAVLVKVKSPSAMKAVGDSLPTDALRLDWYPYQAFSLKAALYLGLREMEWLFLTCQLLGRLSPHGAPVQASEFNPAMVLDTIPEKEDGEDDIDDCSGGDATEFDLMFTSSAPHYPKSFQVRVIELQRRSDVERQQRFYNEFEVYLSLEIAYQSGQLRDRITPHCHGAFEGGRTDVLILGLCGDTLKGWDELNFSEQTQVYESVWNLHRVGIVHGDLEPRNITRVPGGGFRLIDFSESVRHTCVEISGKSNKRYKCSELQAMRGVLKPESSLRTLVIPRGPRGGELNSIVENADLVPSNLVK
ncbi:hypothetical protein EDB83DRAFT_2548114 [Lactarius deliciosus]|nr:hypothetical protein EDB83DRAFT_2548114 [Lactarius deliciosus]